MATGRGFYRRVGYLILFLIITIVLYYKMTDNSTKSYDLKQETIKQLPNYIPESNINNIINSTSLNTTDTVNNEVIIEPTNNNTNSLTDSFIPLTNNITIDTSSNTSFSLSTDLSNNTTTNSTNTRKLSNNLPFKSILAFGDSLTEGYVNPPRFHPYTKRLNELLDNQIVIYNKGISGDITSNMIDRMKEFYQNHSADVAIILGGTNDIGMQFDTYETFDNIVKLHDIALSHPNTLFTIAVTIPEIQSHSLFNNKRTYINNRLKKLCESNKRIHYFDIDLYINHTSDNSNTLWSRDNVHFSKIGYDTFGEALYHNLVNH